MKNEKIRTVDGLVKNDENGFMFGVVVPEVALLLGVEKIFAVLKMLEKGAAGAGVVGVKVDVGVVFEDEEEEEEVSGAAVVLGVENIAKI
jgi:hypothetical protein